MPHQLPHTIETAIRQQLLTPLAEVLGGQRPARDLDQIAAPDVVRRLTLNPRRSSGCMTVRTILTQKVEGRDALEIAATITGPAGHVHPLGVRIERRDSRPLIVAVATNLWGYPA